MYYPYTKYPELIDKCLNNSIPELEELKYPEAPKLTKATYEQLFISVLCIPF